MTVDVLINSTNDNETCRLRAEALKTAESTGEAHTLRIQQA